MLLHLSVENFILIPKLDINIHKGFTCITGETGAGKSILVGALSLILGQRADSSVLRDKAQKCIVEGSFSIEGYGLESIFEDNDLDFEINTTIRREINPQGKSRAFINDTPVNLNVLKLIGEKLVDIHSQHQTLELNEAAFQLAIVDSYAGNADLLSQYSVEYKTLVSMRSELANCVRLENESIAEREFLNYQFEELENANLQMNEQTEAEEELEVLTHAEEIKSRTFAAVSVLAENEPNLLDQLLDVRQQLDYASRLSHMITPVSVRVNECYIELKDIATELRGFSEQLNYDPEKIEKLTQRLDLIYHLQQKHRVQSIPELIDLQARFSEKLLAIGTLEARISALKATILTKETELSGLCDVLSQRRSEAIPKIEAELSNVLSNLGMPSARFKINISSTEGFTSNGTDFVSFLFSANKGGEIKEIQKVASGGELSRLMLALKSLVLNRSMLPTILFDEIDTGVSGEIAGKVGNIMSKMSKQMQVVAITHLPQIAGKADSHLLAFKLDTGSSTVSSIRTLTAEERINEIARMLSDETITDSARLTARELLNF